MNKLVRTLAVVGSRDINVPSGLDDAGEFLSLNKLTGLDTIVSGGARGGDRVAELLARNLSCEFVVYKPDWMRFGRGAGYIRNQLIVDDADACLALWDGESKGTRHTINLCLDKGIPVFVLIVQKEEDHE
jgi:hypothetical protein